MCVVSMVYDHYWDKWKDLQPSPAMPPAVPMPFPFVMPFPVPAQPPPITPEEIEEFRKLLDRAREYDRRNNEPDCELAEKRERLKKLSEELGVEIAFV